MKKPPNKTTPKTSKTRKYATGGLAGIAGSANTLMREVDDMSKKIKFGAGAGAPGSLDFTRGGIGFPASNSTITPARGGIGFPASNSTIASTRGNVEQDYGGTPGLVNFGLKKGGKVKAKKYAKGGSIDGCAIKGKTKGKVI